MTSNLDRNQAAAVLSFCDGFDAGLRDGDKESIVAVRKLLHAIIQSSTADQLRAFLTVVSTMAKIVLKEPSVENDDRT